MLDGLAEQIVEHSVDGIVALDRELRFIAWNRGMERITGLGAAEVLGKNALDVLPFLRATGEDESLRRVFTSGAPVVVTERKYEIPSTGRSGFFDASYSPLYDAEGGIMGVGAVVHETSARMRAAEDERVRALSRIEETLRVREQFTSIASHELRTPLTALRLQIERLARLAAKPDAPPLEPAKVSKLVEVAARQVDRLTRLIDEMLDISRITRQKLIVRAHEVALSPLVERVVARLSENLAAAGCVVTLELAPGVVGRWDEPRVEQLMTILLTNALKYAPSAPVVVTTSSSDGQVRLVVRDQGPGIAATHHERIFQCFERATAPEEVSGLGLGLYIARQIAEAHGGSISVTSEPGQGAAFTVEMPLELPPLS